MTAPISSPANGVTAPGTNRHGWLARPGLSILLALAWLALAHSLAPIHLLSAALLGLCVPRLVSSFLPPPVTVHWGPALRLTAVVLRDIVVANWVVARLVLGPMGRMHPLWLRVPLATDHPQVNALFATIITTTPGTVSCVVDEVEHCIWVHALDCSDEAAMVADMKLRYETPLMCVFGVNGERTGDGRA